MGNKAITWIKKLLEFDPLSGRLLTKSPVVTAICVSFLQLSIWWFLGKWTVTRYGGLRIIGPTDPQELYFAIFLWGLFLPIIWWFYLSLDGIWTRMAESLVREKVIIDPAGFSHTIQSNLKKTYILLAVVVSIVLLFFYYTKSIPDELSLGRTSFWYITLAGKIIVGFFTGVNATIFISFVLRTLTLIMVMKDYFKKHGIKVIHVYHIDKCGGFASVGNLAMIISSLAVAAGVWAIWYMFLPLLSSSEFNISITGILVFIAYIFIVPLLLFSLILPVSQAMKRYKQTIVMKVSKKLQDELNIITEGSPGFFTNDGNFPVLQKIEEYQKLSSFFDHLNAMPESPIRAANLKRFSGFASIPLLVGVISFVADLFQIFAGL